MLFGKCDNFPTFHVLSNRYFEERKITDKKIKRSNNIICAVITICAIAIVVVYPNILAAIVVGIVALIVAITMSSLTQKYMEETLQKKMSIELESEKTSESASTISSNIETQNEEESFFAELPARQVVSKLESTAKEPILDMEEANSRCRQ